MTEKEFEQEVQNIDFEVGGWFITPDLRNRFARAVRDLVLKDADIEMKAMKKCLIDSNMALRQMGKILGWDSMDFVINARPEVQDEHP